MATIRDARPDEVAGLIDMARPTFLGAWPFAVPDARVASILSGLIGTANGFFRVVEHQGEAAGFLAAMIAPFLPWSGAATAIEFFLFIREDRRGSRDVVALIRDYVGWAEAKGCDMIHLASLAALDGDRVGKLYERLGFRPIETNFIRMVGTCG